MFMVADGLGRKIRHNKKNKSLSKRRISPYSYSLVLTHPQCFTFRLTEEEASMYQTSFRREKKDPNTAGFPTIDLAECHRHCPLYNILSPHDNPVLISSVLLLCAVSFMSHILPDSKVPFRSFISCESYQLRNINRVLQRGLESS